MSDTLRVSENRPVAPVVADHTFVVAATAFAAVYGLFVLARLWPASPADGEELVVTMSIGDDPRVFIAVSVVFAAAFLWLWRGAAGKVLALLSYGYAHVQFGQWFAATAQVRSNTGREVIPQAGSLGNWLLGAGWFDLFALLAVTALTGYGLHFLRLSLRGGHGVREAEEGEERRGSSSSATEFKAYPRT